MEVRIDGVLYAPVGEPPDAIGVEAALEIRMGETDAGNNLTIRQYLHALLSKLWQEQEGFSSKRPFGNSSWEFEIYTVLAKNGYSGFGSIDTDGYYVGNSKEQAKAHAFVSNMINYVFFKKE